MSPAVRAREHQAEMQAGLRADQAEVGRQRDSLEGERRDLARERHLDPLIAAAITDVGLVLACLLPLGVAVYVMWAAGRSRDADAAVTEILIQEIVSDRPRLLPPAAVTPPALTVEPRLPDHPAETGSG